MKKKLIFKVILAVLIIVPIATLIKIYSPVIGAGTVIDQLNDDYSSHASVKVWENVKRWQGLFYVGVVVVLFGGDIARKFNKKEEG